MKPVSEVTFCVCDHNLFLELALRLSREAGRVLYWTPTEKGFPIINDGVIGRGFPQIERCDDFWPILDEIDCFVFPDIQHSGLQVHLEQMGKAVWGSRHGDSLELERVRFLKLLDKLELPAPKFKVVLGLDDLRIHLRANDDKYIKVSRWRGSMETWHHINYKLSEPMLDLLAVRFGPIKNTIPFVVCDPIDTELEVGYDGYCVDGKFPKTAIQGYEAKDKAYICSVMPYDQLPKEVTVINDAFEPLLSDFRYRNFWSTEIRVKNGESYFIDPCARGPVPASEAQYELYSNLGEIIWHGANGELVEPVLTAQFAVEAGICIKRDKTSWATIEVPDKAKQWVKIGSSCQIHNEIAIPPEANNEDEIGWIVGIGNTILEAIDHLKSNADQLDDCRVKVNLDAIGDLLEEIHEAEKSGIEFTTQTVPEPESIMKE